MLYDPEDDDCKEAFELEQYIAILVDYEIDAFRLKYVEFDRRLMQYTLQENEKLKEAEALFKIIESESEHTPFFRRSYWLILEGAENRILLR